MHFPQAKDKSLHVMIIKISTVRGDTPFHSYNYNTVAEMQHPPPHCVHIHWLVSTNVQQISEGPISSIWRKSMTHLCFICTYMSDTILSDCPSAAICHMVTNVKILVGKFNLYFHTTTVLPLMLWLNIVNLGGITSGEALIQHVSYNEV